jgi:hypothetical protein
MINFETQFQRMDKEYDKLYEKYLEFKDNMTFENKNNLIRQMKKFNENRSNFITSIRNLSLKK